MWSKHNRRSDAGAAQANKHGSVLYGVDALNTGHLSPRRLEIEPRLSAGLIGVCGQNQMEVYKGASFLGVQIGARVFYDVICFGGFVRIIERGHDSLFIQSDLDEFNCFNFFAIEHDSDEVVLDMWSSHMNLDFLPFNGGYHHSWEIELSISEHYFKLILSISKNARWIWFLLKMPTTL
ncbi:unnamed protein product [Cuscuta europaea]|uniref:Uncharacterized protein n=1 Tax=Cuscuta europaea TaxID=41803 RepID=A0A9P0ZRZ7_CUSEU|nr:unnamed protein product [Cuscuta europaea]